MPKKASDNYIRLEKKITNANAISTINRIATEKMCSPQEVCMELIRQGVTRENERQQKLIEFKKSS